MRFYAHSFFKNILLSSTPFNYLIEYEDYNLKEALSVIIPDPVPTTGLVSSSAPLPHQEDERTFLSLHLFKLYRRHSTIPLQFLTQPSAAIQNCTFDHLIWSKRKWNKIWKSKLFVLNPITVPVPTIETTFHGTLLHIHLTTEHLTSSTPQFAQGTLITIKGDDTSHVRYVVEWCEHTDSRNAYLNVVGMGQHGNPCPYNDPLYPAFLLVVPLYLLDVQTRTYAPL